MNRKIKILISQGNNSKTFQNKTFNSIVNNEQNSYMQHMYINS